MSTAGRHVYFAQDATDPRRLVKIGASNEPPKRVRNLGTSIGRPMNLLGVIHDQRVRGERALHARWEACRADAPDLPTNEWFEPAPALMAFIEDAAEDFRPPKPKVRERSVPQYEQWLRPEEAAEILGWTPKQVRAAARDRKIPHGRLSSRTFRFRRSELEAWIETQNPARAVVAHVEDNSRTAESTTPHLRKGREPEGYGDWSAPHPGAHAGREG
jgi:excisionase family DNA binding protein